MVPLPFQHPLDEFLEIYCPKCSNLRCPLPKVLEPNENSNLRCPLPKVLEPNETNTGIAMLE
jgi:hypothetical protein